MPDAALTEVTRTHLELTARDKLKASPRPDGDVKIRRLDAPTPEQYLDLYSQVGGPWHWRDRLAWERTEMQNYLARPDVSVHRLEVDGVAAGYFELVQHGHGVVEIMYFGLGQRFIGRKLGGWLLTRAVEESFALGATRVILNTCTLDSPHALPNYLARGFVITRQERYLAPLSTPPAPRTSA